jgi:hypothetical protein
VVGPGSTLVELDTVTERCVLVELPAASRATAVSVCCAFEDFVVSQLTP